MSNSPHLDLPLVAAGQAQKHVTVNDSLLALDAIVQLSVQSRTVTTPPTAPATGDRYLVPAGAIGAWAGRALQIARFSDGGWDFHIPKQGWLAYIVDESQIFVHDGVTWLSLAERLNELSRLGINTTADTANRLAVASAGSLFTHAGAGHRLALNKAAQTDTASLLFQTGFSSRAEIGLNGDDRLSIKSSPDGTQWQTNFSVEPQSAGVGIGLSMSSAVARLQVEGPNTSSAWFINTGAPSGISGAGLIGYSYSLPVTSGDRLGFLLFGSLANGQQSCNATGISGFAEGSWSAGTSHPSYLRFETTPSGSSTRSERMRITANGRVGIGTTSPTCLLQVEGPARIGNSTVASLPAASTVGAGTLVFVSNESGGAVLAFSDGTAWRRVTDRAVVS